MTRFVDIEMNKLNPTFQPDKKLSTAGEATFRPEEIFFSRTDERGVIAQANAVFQRISGFTWDEIKGAPHKIVRHPDMPKAVFQLMWDRLKADLPLVAYVKNRTKEGQFYWVLAITWPLGDGYLSVRIKPTSDLFKQIPALYAELLEAEKDGMTPEQSRDLLLERLREMNFDTFEAFMAAALTKESTERSNLMGRAPDPIIARFREMFRTVRMVGQQTDEMTEVISAIRTVPMNMRILASRLENAGGPISAISVNYGSMLDEMATWVKDFVEGEDSTYMRIRKAIQSGQFLLCAASLQREMSKSFEQDIANASDPEQLRGEQALLNREAAKYNEQVVKALKVVETEVTRLSRSVLDMKRYVTGLSSTRMMCKIESAALYGTGDTSLSGIVDQLDAGQNEIEEKLTGIVQLNSTIQSHTSMIRNMT